MTNPGLDAFAAETIYKRPPAGHPIFEDPDEDDDYSDYMPPRDFSQRAHNPGYSRNEPIPTVVGPRFHPEENPENVIQGEVISPEEEKAADGILHGDHDSSEPSQDPLVEQARQGLRTPGADVAVHTISKLLGGHGVPDSDLRDSHEWLRQHFNRVRVNPEEGRVEVASPFGKQVMERHEHLPAVPGEPPETTYSLTNKHGTFEVPDHDKPELVRSMVAFQIATNGFGLLKKKKDQDDQNKNGLSSTASGFSEFLNRMTGGKPTQLRVPAGSIFEPGNGYDRGPQGALGGWVTKAENALPGWHVHQGAAYSPQHNMRLLLDPKESSKVRADPRYPGATLTLQPRQDTGHTIPRAAGNLTYYTDELHPAVRYGFDVPKGAARPHKPPNGTMRRGPRVPPHPTPISGGGTVTPPPPPPTTPHTSAAQVNDVCPVCASGYLDPYDDERYECRNCGSLVAHVGFEKRADARPKGGLGRGLGQIHQDTSDAIGVDPSSAKSQQAATQPASEPSAPHLTRTEQLPDDFEGYEAPTELREKGQAGGRREAAFDYNRREFLFDVDDPGYPYNDRPPSAHSYSKQPMFKTKEAEPYNGNEMEDEEGHLLNGEPLWDSEYHHPSAQVVCQRCGDVDEVAAGVPSRWEDPLAIHDARNPSFNYHKFEPAEDLPAGERLASVRTAAEDEDPVYDFDPLEEDDSDDSAEREMQGFLRRRSVERNRRLNAQDPPRDPKGRGFKESPEDACNRSRWLDSQYNVDSYGRPEGYAYNPWMIGGMHHDQRCPIHSDQYLADDMAARGITNDDLRRIWNTDSETGSAASDEARWSPYTAAAEVDPLDEHLGKYGFQPLHDTTRPGPRAYAGPLPGGLSGQYARLTEYNRGQGWKLSVDDATPPPHEWHYEEGTPTRLMQALPHDRDPVNTHEEDMGMRRLPLPDVDNRPMGDQATVAAGYHPVDDEQFSHAINDLMTNGRNSRTYQRGFRQQWDYPPMPEAGGAKPTGTQKDLRLMSSENPGRTRWAA